VKRVATASLQPVLGGPMSWLQFAGRPRGGPRLDFRLRVCTRLMPHWGCSPFHSRRNCLMSWASSAYAFAYRLAAWSSVDSPMMMILRCDVTRWCVCVHRVRSISAAPQLLRSGWSELWNTCHLTGLILTHWFGQQPWLSGCGDGRVQLPLVPVWVIGGGRKGIQPIAAVHLPR